MAQLPPSEKDSFFSLPLSSVSFSQRPTFEKKTGLKAALGVVCR